MSSLALQQRMSRGPAAFRAQAKEIMKPLEILVAAASLATATGCEYHGDPPPLALTEVEIIRMSKEGMPPDEIIDAIRRSRTIT